GHGLDLEVLLEALAAHLAADAGLLVAAARDVGAVPLAAVDAERAGADPCDDPLDALGIGAPSCAGKALGGVVGERDRVSVTGGGDHHEHGPEDLLLRDAGGVVQARDEGRLDPEALVLVVAGGAAAAELDGASLFVCEPDVALDALTLGGRDDRPAEGARVVRVVRSESGHGALGGLDGLVVLLARHE